MANPCTSIKEDANKFGASTISILMLIYFAQGFRSFGSTAQTLYFKNLYSLDPSELSLVSALLTISWYLKPFYGLMSDCIPIFGYHRKYYIFLSGFMGVLAYIVIFFSESLLISIIALIIGELSQAVADVICDGFMVEKARIDPVHGANDLQRYSWGALFFASVIGTVIGGNAADYVDPRYLVGMLALCPCFVCIAAFFMEEKKVTNTKSFKKQCKKIGKSLKLLYNEVKTPRVLKMVIFLIFWQITSLGFGTIYVYFLYDVIQIQPSTISYYTLLSYIGGFIATVIGSKHFIKMNLINRLALGRAIYTGFTIFDIIIVTKYYEVLGISYLYVMYGSATLGNIIDMLFSRMPLLIIFAQITPHTVEASFYAMLSSIFNFGMSLSEVLVSMIMQATGIDSAYSPYIWVLFVISMIVGFLSLGFLGIISEEVNSQPVNESLEEDNANRVIEEPLISKIGKTS